MGALTAERDTPRRSTWGYRQNFPQKTNTKIFNGGLVNTDATGFAVPAADTANHHCFGRATQTRDTTAAGPDGVLADGVAGNLSGVGIETEAGIFELDNPANGGNQLTQADVLKTCCVLSDHEVTRAAGTANAIVAGVVLSVDLVLNKAVVDTTRKA